MSSERPMSSGEAARRLGVHVSTVGRWIRLGLLPATRTPGPRGQYRIAAQAVERLRRQMEEGEGPTLP
jgi:excisionase family DNA binding protein